MEYSIVASKNVPLHSIAASIIIHSIMHMNCGHNTINVYNNYNVDGKDRALTIHHAYAASSVIV